MTIKIGDRLPDISIMVAAEGGPAKTTVSEVFSGKTVALFAVPGAFTPTCSAKHLPGFLALADALKAKGVDEIACISVNDAFVMGAWGAANNTAGKITMLADGNGEFTRAIGLELDGSGFGMGPRSQRYSMLVVDGVVKQLNVDEGGAFNVSSAEHLMGQL